MIRGADAQAVVLNLERHPKLDNGRQNLMFAADLTMLLNDRSREADMGTEERIRVAAKLLKSRNWVSFDELTSVSGLTRDELIAAKQRIEELVRADAPGASLTSRIDLSPQGFEVES